MSVIWVVKCVQGVHQSYHKVIIELHHMSGTGRCAVIITHRTQQFDFIFSSNRVIRRALHNLQSSVPWRTSLVFGRCHRTQPNRTSVPPSQRRAIQLRSAPIQVFQSPTTETTGSDAGHFVGEFLDTLYRRLNTSPMLTGWYLQGKYKGPLSKRLQ